MTRCNDRLEARLPPIMKKKAPVADVADQLEAGSLHEHTRARPAALVRSDLVLLASTVAVCLAWTCVSSVSWQRQGHAGQQWHAR